MQRDLLMHIKTRTNTGLQGGPPRETCLLCVNISTVDFTASLLLRTQGYKKEGRRVHIVSNVDPDDAAQVILVLLHLAHFYFYFKVFLFCFMKSVHTCTQAHTITHNKHATHTTDNKRTILCGQNRHGADACRRKLLQALQNLARGLLQHTCSTSTN